MKNDLLDKHKNDPTWSEIVRLYSGLFDTLEERENFILDISNTNIFLAAECKNNSFELQEEIQTKLTEKAVAQLNKNKYSEALSISAFFALAELDRFDLISELLQNIRKSNIPLIQGLLRSLPETTDGQKILLTSVFLKPEFFISVFFSLAEKFEQKQLIFSVEVINNLFSVLIENKLNCNKILFFIEKYFNKLICIEKYKEYAINEIGNIQGYTNLRKWLKYFNLELPLNKLTQILIQNASPRSLFNILNCFDDLLEFEKIDFLNQILVSEEIGIQALFMILLHKNRIQKTKLKDKMLFNKYSSILNNTDSSKFKEINEYKIFIKEYSKIKTKLSAFNIYENVEIGDILTITINSERINHYTAFPHDYKLRFATYLIPKTETQIESPEGKTCESVIIHINKLEKKIFLSSRQVGIPKHELTFREEYSSMVNIGDIVDCKIGMRFDTKVYVRIVGAPKQTKAVIQGENNLIPNGVNSLKAKIISLKGSVFYMSIKGLNTEIENSKSIFSELSVGIMALKNNKKIGILQKFLFIINDRIKPNTDFTIESFHSLIGAVSGQRINDLFPSKYWLINILSDNFYICLIENKKRTYKLLKSVDIFILNLINAELQKLNFPILSSYGDYSNILQKPDLEINKAYSLKIYDLVTAIVSNINFFGIKLKIEGVNLTANIFISELSDKAVRRIDEYIYNGSKLYIGQKIVGRVISIDAKLGINLSLKRV